MTDLASTLSQLRVEEPSWLHDSRGVPGSPPAEAAGLLADLDAEDLGVFVLTYGFGMRLGAVAQTLRLDPAIVLWRVQRALSRWTETHGTRGREASLEVGVTDLLRGHPGHAGHEPIPAPLEGRTSWLARDLAESLGDEVHDRLTARIDAERVPEPAVSGIGVGTIGLIVLAVVGFAVSGWLSDLNPYERGKGLMLKGEFAAARNAFLKAGDTDEVRRQVALCWLADGQFDRALEAMDAEVQRGLGSFAPKNRALPPLEAPLDGRALLPRGTILNSQPTFVIAPGPAADLVVTVLLGPAPRSVGMELPDTSDASGPVEVAFPENWPKLPSAAAEWRLGDGQPVAFSLLDAELRDEIQGKVRSTMRTRDLPEAAKDFLLGHYYRNKGLLTSSADAFVRLVDRFPDAAYPREQVAELSRALGVDPSVFLR